MIYNLKYVYIDSGKENIGKIVGVLNSRLNEYINIV